MDRTNWLLVPFVFWCAFPVQSQGHELCYENSWYYHGALYSCVKRFGTHLTWTDARDHCLGIRLGSFFGVTTRLIKIDDSNDNRVARLRCNNPSCWIGLYYNEEKAGFRWDGYPDETPRYNDSHWPVPQGTYVAVTNDGWIGQGDSDKHKFVCEHAAKRISEITCIYHVVANGLTITCTSQKSPIAARCEWTHKYERDADFSAWQSILGPTQRFQRESTGEISFTTTCTANVDKRTVTVKMKMYPHTSVGGISDRDDIITVGSIDIVEPDRPVLSLSPNKSINQTDVILVQGSIISLTCTFDTGSPDVYTTSMSCQSPILDENHTESSTQQGVSLTTTIGPVRRDMDGKTCSCWGSHVTGDTESSTLTFTVVTKPTNVTCESEFTPTGLQMSCHIEKVYPEALSVWAYRYHNEEFNPVSAPGCPHDNYTDNGGFLYSQSNCSVTLTPDNMTFSPGNLTIQVKLNPNQAGIDEDATADAFITKQETVNIVPPEMPVFKLLNQTLQTSSPIHFSENDRIYLTCEAPSGNPSVQSVTLSCQFPFHNSDAANKNMVTGIAYVMDETASRDMNGKNCTCIGNHLTGQYESFPLTFDVTSPLTLCKGQESVAYQVKLGQPVSIFLCVTAFHSPFILVLQKANKNSTWQDYNNPNVRITMGIDFDTLKNVTVSFSEVLDMGFGEYRIFDSSQAGVSYIHFNISELPDQNQQGGGGSGGTDGAVVGAVVSVVIVIIIVVVVIIFILRRRRNRNKKKESHRASDAIDNKTYCGRDDYTQVDFSKKSNKSDGINNQTYGRDDYTEVDFSKKSKNKRGGETPVYNNEGFVCGHVNDKNQDEENIALDTDRPYSNVVLQNNTPDNAGPDSNTPKDDNDLIYIKLDFDLTTDRRVKPDKKKKSKPKSKPKKAKEEEEDDGEATEYSAISATATIKIKRDKENEERRKNEDECDEKGETEGSEQEEKVYENVNAADNVP